MTAFHLASWEDALEEFLLHLEASRAPKTVRYYKVQLLGLSRWCIDNSVTLQDFTKRCLDRYLVERQKAGKSQLTLHHDAITAKVFFKWCAREKVLERSPLAEYEVRDAPVPQRTVPISTAWSGMLADWLKTRERIMKAAEEDEGYLFISESGGRLDECRAAGTLKKFVKFAELPERITLHGLRRYSINRLSKVDVLAAQRIAGHKETKTTLLYTELDPEHLREAHARAASAAGIVNNKRLEKRKRLV